MKTKQIGLDELDSLVPLFDQYMVFYGQPSAKQKYRDYLQARLERNEAVVFVAFSDNKVPMGFVLNYLSFSSVSLGKIVVLNDLFVHESHRKLGVANALIACSIDLAKQTGAVRVDLNTAKTNLKAQGLYEKIGFVRDREYYSYNFGVCKTT